MEGGDILTTDCRISLRRAAVRALYSQPSRCIPTIRRSNVSRVTSFQQSKPALYRAFHQTRIWRAGEQETKPEGVVEVPLEEVETSGEPAPTEPISQDAEGLRDQSAAAAEDEYHGSTVAAEAVQTEQPSMKEKAEDIAASAVDTV